MVLQQRDARVLWVSLSVWLAGAFVLLLPAAASAREYVLELTATAYNSVPEQTDDTPDIAAWGDRLDCDMKVIAVSRDLLAAGLSYGVPVTIDGLPGEYVVLDKMASRWRNRIDIFMGKDIRAARQWGNRKVTIRYWTVDDEPAPDTPAEATELTASALPTELPPGLPELVGVSLPGAGGSMVE
jgi:3D (Asp-Asp-Asp) domain-containing protein